jgi:hypothetical protein
MSPDASVLRSYSELLHTLATAIRTEYEKGTDLIGNETVLGGIVSSLEQLLDKRKEVLQAAKNAGAVFDSIHNTLNTCENRTLEMGVIFRSDPPGGLSQVLHHLHALQNCKKEIDDLADWAEVNARKSKGSTGPKVGPNDERDQWLLDELNKSGKDERPLDDIVSELNKSHKSRGWEDIATPQGIRQAAIRYADRKHLPRPRKRRSG